MKNDLVSIILPVYNGEKYIENCVNSLLKQTYKNIEIIIVNDGSTDSTEEKINTFSEEKIKKISILNQGVSSARNIAINAAKGQYIMFVDVDDTLAENAVEKLYERIEIEKVDILRYNGYIENRNGQFKPLEFPINDNLILDSSKTEDKEKILDLYNRPKDSLRGYCWLLFMKNDRIIEFNPKLAYLEDKLFNIENLLNNKKTLFVNECYYYYKYNENSKTKKLSVFVSNIEEILETKTYFVDIAKKNKYFKEDDINANYLTLVLYRIDFLVSNNNFKNTKETIKKVLELLKSNNINLQTYNGMNKIKRLQIILLKRNWYFLYYLLTKMKERIK